MFKAYLMDWKTMIFLFVLFFISGSGFAENDKIGFIPESFLLEGIPAEKRNELLALNRELTTSNFAYCADRNNEVVNCPIGLDSVKFLIFKEAKTIKAVSSTKNGYEEKEMNSIEKIITYKLLEYFDQKKEKKKKANKSYSKKLEGEQSYSSGEWSGTDWCSSSPDIFPFACQKHDFCYESGIGKGPCDDMFLQNMFNEISLYMAYNPSDVDTMDELTTIAFGYHEAVVHHGDALTAFCNATPSPNSHDICDSHIADLLDQNDLEHTRDTDGGTYTGGNAGGEYAGGISPTTGGTVVISWSCQIWSFPDGNGGRYLLNRNCTFQYRHTGSNWVD